MKFQCINTIFAVLDLGQMKLLRFHENTGKATASIRVCLLLFINENKYMMIVRKFVRIPDAPAGRQRHLHWRRRFC